MPKTSSCSQISSMLCSGSTVFVVAYNYSSGGGGFDWYKSLGVAQVVFESEVRESRDANWSGVVYQFSFNAISVDEEDITNEIEDRLESLCESAEIKQLL